MLRVLMAASLLVVACAETQEAGERDGDAVAVQKISERAVLRAKEVASDAVLRQVDLDGFGLRSTFKLTDDMLIQVIS